MFLRSTAKSSTENLNEVEGKLKVSFCMIFVVQSQTWHLALGLIL